MTLIEENASRAPIASPFAEERASFLTRTYLHLLGAIVGFVFVEILLFGSGMAIPIARAMLGTSWLVVLGGFILVGWLGSFVAHHAKSEVDQYAALAGYVLAEALIFVPLLCIAEAHAPGVLEGSAALTLLGFGMLTAVAYLTRRDFSFLHGILMWGSGVVILLIISSVAFDFQLGSVFLVAMIAFAGCAVLRSTSNVLKTYPRDRHIAAALQLFSSITLLFWYVLSFAIDASD